MQRLYSRKNIWLRNIQLVFAKSTMPPRLAVARVRIILSMTVLKLTTVSEFSLFVIWFLCNLELLLWCLPVLKLCFRHLWFCRTWYVSNICNEWTQWISVTKARYLCSVPNFSTDSLPCRISSLQSRVKNFCFACAMIYFNRISACCRCFACDWQCTIFLYIRLYVLWNFLTGLELTLTLSSSLVDPSLNLAILLCICSKLFFISAATLSMSGNNL